MPYFLKYFVIAAMAIILTSCGGNKNSSGESASEINMGDAEEAPPEETSGGGHEVDLDILKKAVESEPDIPHARFVYMTGLERSGQYKEALEQCRILGDMDSDNPYKSVAYLNFGTIILDDVPKDDPDRAALVQEAIDYLWIGLGMEPESIPAHRVIGLLALESGDKDRALHHLAIALSSTEIGYEARISMAEIYIERGDNVKAREHLEVALELAVEAEDHSAETRIKGLLRQIK